MTNSMWSSWGASIIGPMHIKNGIPNQDSWKARQYKWGNVLVVSDGLGSKPHSDHGSKAACLAVFEAAKTYQNNRQAKIPDILRLIHANWLVKVAPFSPSDCSATCLFAIQIDEQITLGRLGDGLIAVYGESEKDCFILSDKKQDSFSNYTYSLHHEFKPNQWETVTIDSSSCKAILLCTDGISDDLLPESEIKFTQEFVDEYRNIAPNMRAYKLKSMLSNWPVPCHSDDKTIAVLYKKRGV
jgi:serine/threonine protein phosphatase PrpC